MEDYPYRHYDAEGSPSTDAVQYSGRNDKENERLNQAAKCYDLISAELLKRNGIFMVAFQSKRLSARFGDSRSIHLLLAGKPIILGQQPKDDLDRLFQKLSNPQPQHKP